MPKVSVVIPNYNYGRFLRQRVVSVLDQTFRDFEIIYLDDASTDDSRRIMSQFAADPRIRIFENAANGANVFAQWNRGVRHAAGVYVWIAEADDFADPRFLARTVDCLDRNPGVGLAWCQSRIVDEQGRVAGSMETAFDRWGRDRWRHDFIRDGVDEARQCLAYVNTIPNASAVLFRRAIYQQVSGGNERYRLCGDWYTWLQIALTSEVAFLAEPLNYYRCHDRSVRRVTRRDGTYPEEAGRILLDAVRRIGLRRISLRRVLSQTCRLGLRYMTNQLAQGIGLT